MRGLSEILGRFKYWLTVPYEVKVQTEVLAYAREKLAKKYPSSARGGILTPSQLSLLGFCLAEGLVAGKGKRIGIGKLVNILLFKGSALRNAAQQLSGFGLIEWNGSDIEGLTKKGERLASAIFSPITSLGRVLGFLIFLMFTLFVYFFIPSLFFVATGSILGYAQLFAIVLVVIGVAYIGCFLIPAFFSLQLRKRRIDKAVET